MNLTSGYDVNNFHAIFLNAERIFQLPFNTGRVFHNIHIKRVHLITTLGSGATNRDPFQITVMIFSFRRYDLRRSTLLLFPLLRLFSLSLYELHREKRRSPTPGHRELPTERDCTAVDHLYLHLHDVPLHPERLPESAA